MTPDQIKCPDCPGMMELRHEGDGLYYTCFVCHGRKSLAAVKAEQHWYGSAHLPLITFFIRPRVAVQQMRDHPVPIASLVIFLVSAAARQRLNGALIPGLPLHGHLGAIVQVALSLVDKLVFAWIICRLANGMGGRGSFSGFWPIVLFVEAMFNGLGLIPNIPHLQPWMLWIACWIYLSYAGTVYYRFDEVDALMSMVLGLSLRAVVQSVFLTAIGLSFTNTVGISPLNLFSSRPSIRPVHRPADYTLLFQRYENADLRPQGLSIRASPITPLSALRGKVIFLNFWATWCGPCGMEMPSIQRLADKLQDNPNIVFLIVSDEPPGKIMLFQKHYHYHLPFQGYDPQTAQAYPNQAIPVTYIISKDGWIVGEHEGATRWDTKANIKFLEDLSREQPGASPS